MIRAPSAYSPIDSRTIRGVGAKMIRGIRGVSQAADGWEKVRGANDSRVIRG